MGSCVGEAGKVPCEYCRPQGLMGTRCSPAQPSLPFSEWSRCLGGLRGFTGNRCLPKTVEGAGILPRAALDLKASQSRYQHFLCSAQGWAAALRLSWKQSFYASLGKKAPKLLP